MCACAALVLRFTICSVWYVALGLLGRDAAVARAASREHYHCAHWPGALAPCPAAHGLPQPMSCCGRAVRQAAQCTCTSPGHLPSPASRRLLQRREREREIGLVVFNTRWVCIAALLLHGDAEALPFEQDGLFDAVLCNFGLLHLGRCTDVVVVVVVVCCCCGCGCGCCFPPPLPAAASAMHR